MCASYAKKHLRVNLFKNNDFQTIKCLCMIYESLGFTVKKTFRPPFFPQKKSSPPYFSFKKSHRPLFFSPKKPLIPPFFSQKSPRPPIDSPGLSTL